MYIPPHFREVRPAIMARLVRENPFGIMVTTDAGETQASHLAFTYEAPPGSNEPVLLGHLAAANAQCTAVLRGAQALVVFNGPHHYVSPHWYASVPAEPSTPTWNYSTVHVTGTLLPAKSPEDTDTVLDTLVTAMEKEHTPALDYRNLPVEYRQMRTPGILAFQIDIHSMEAQFKMSQNRTPEDRMGVIQGLRETGDDSGAAVAAIMEQLLEEEQKK